MTVRFFGLIPRLQSISTEEFHDHYRYPHGALGLGLDKMKAYVQSHQIPTEHLPGSQSRFEAVAEGWYDTVDDGVGLASNAHYVAHLLPDEALFVDADRLKWLYADEVTAVDSKDACEDIAEADRWWSPDVVPNSIKMLQFLSAEDAASRDELISAAWALGAKRYAFSEPNPAVYETDEPAFYAVREIWWPTRWDAEAGIQRAQDAWQAMTTLGNDSVSLLAHAERFR
jgi:hypothetical protein